MGLASRFRTSTSPARLPCVCFRTIDNSVVGVRRPTTAACLALTAAAPTSTTTSVQPTISTRLRLTSPRRVDVPPAPPLPSRRYASPAPPVDTSSVHADRDEAASAPPLGV